MKSLSGHILTPQGFVHGVLEFDATGRIARVQGEPVAEERVRDSALPLMLPGFIDLHVHGGGGHDIMEGGDALARISALHAQFGTTSLLATTMTAPLEDIDRAFAAMRDSTAAPRGKGAHVLGAHLEGPYLSQGRLGAQPDFTRAASVTELLRWNTLCPIRLVTLAPEVGANMEVIESLCAAGFKVQIGHTAGSYEDGVQALAKGASSFTHLFNAMTPLQHRAPGMVGAALAHAQYAELIPDLIHVHPGAIRVALRAIPHLYCVTDSTAAAGMPDGTYRLGLHTVTKCLGGVRLADGTLAGSTLTMDQALRNLVHALGLTLADASRRVSTNAAEHLGLSDRGRLAPGAWGDVVLLDRDLKLTDVYLEGSSIEHANAD